ncbi:MAG: hypothetical protein WAU33_03765 [Candidatus Binataceae bacterium]
MKKLRTCSAMAALIAPVLLICLVIAGSMDGTARAQLSNAIGKNGLVQVGFVANLQFPAGQPTPNLQHIFVNVVAVRLNPKPTGNSTKFPPEDNPKWVTITIPSGTGVGNAGRPGDLQIDLLAGRTQLQLFNTGKARTETYHSVELSLDTTNPGYVVPVCSSVTGTTLEGCTATPLTLQNPSNQISFIATNPIVVQKQAVTTLPLQLNFQINNLPTIQGQPYVGSVTIAQVSAAAYEATITGTVTGAGNGIQKKKVRRLTLSVEQQGTNNVIAFANVINSKYSIAVPAPPAGSGTGASYDLYISGGGVSYEGTRVTGLFAGDTPTVDFTPTKVMSTQGNLAGTITDMCSKAPLIGATLQLLVPPDSNSGADCVTAPTDCVSVATANTGNAGTYPLPGTVTTPAPFSNVPVNPSSSPYTMEISAPGYNSIVDNNVFATTQKTGGKCLSSTTPPGCNYALPTSYIKGSLNLAAAPAAGTYTMVQVFAENHGTNNLVSALTNPLIIRPGNDTATFTINVPANQADAPTSNIRGAANLDLFAQAIDLYAGASDPYPGHNIITAADIAAPTSYCQTLPPNDNLFPAAETMDCIGHGSISGVLNNPDINTFVEISKNYNGTGEVQLYSAAPVSLLNPGSGNPDPLIGNGYTFCVPPDSYTLTRYEGATPVESPVAVATQSITVVPPPLPVPSSSPTPCPTTCQDAGSSTCPGVCSNTSATPF